MAWRIPYLLAHAHLQHSLCFAFSSKAYFQCSICCRWWSCCWLTRGKVRRCQRTTPRCHTWSPPGRASARFWAPSWAWSWRRRSWSLRWALFYHNKYQCSGSIKNFRTVSVTYLDPLLILLNELTQIWSKCSKFDKIFTLRYLDLLGIIQVLVHSFIDRYAGRWERFYAVLRIRDVYPGSWFVSISDPRSRISDPRSWILDLTIKRGGKKLKWLSYLFL